MGRGLTRPFTAKVSLQQLLDSTDMGMDTKLRILNAAARYISKLRHVGMILLQRALQSDSSFACNSLTIWTYIA